MLSLPNKMGAMKIVLCFALVFVVFSAIAEAGSYGANVQGIGGYYQPRQQVYSYYQPARVQYYTTGMYGGYNTGMGLGAGSGNLVGSALPILLIFLLLAIFAPVLIGSLVSSNDMVFSGSN